MRAVKRSERGKSQGIMQACGDWYGGRRQRRVALAATEAGGCVGGAGDGVVVVW